MSTSSFPKKWLQSSRGLPGSFMNENHHTMTHVWKDDNRQKGMTSENQTTSSSSTYASHDTKDEHRIQQHNEMNHSDLLGQEPRRSILGPHNDEFQSQQANFPDDTDFYSRPKENQHPPPIAVMFPQDHLAGGLHKIDQDPPPHSRADVNKSEDTREEVTELGNDPDPATKAAFQSTTEPIMVPTKDDEAAKPSSVAASFGSNRAIKNQPLVSDPIKNDEGVDDYDDDADYYTTSEVMPATYVGSSMSPDGVRIETPTYATPVNMNKMEASANKDDMVSKPTLEEDNALGEKNGSFNTEEEQTAPFKASDMYHQQDQNVSPSMNATESTSNIMNTDKGQMDEDASGGTKSQQESSLSSLPEDNTIQNSLGGIGDKYKNQDITGPTTKQPFYQTGSANTNNEESNDQTLSHQGDPDMSQTNDINPSNKYDGHRRSSLTQSIGKLFGRHHKST